MVRVLFYTGSALLAVSAALLYLPTYFSIVLACLFAIALGFFIIFRHKIIINGIRAFFTILLIFTLFGVYLLCVKLPPAESLAGYKAEVIGTVCERPERHENYSSYYIKTQRIKILYQDGQKKLTEVPQELKIRVSDINSINADTFDKIKFTVTFNELGDFKISSMAHGIYAGGYIDSLEARLGNDRPFYAIFYDLRDGINDLLYKNLNYEEATVISAVLLGDRDGLTDDFEADAKRTGTSHILVVSGAHLGILFTLLDKIFRMLKFPYRTSSLLMLGAIFALIAICGFNPSVLRAGLTYFIMCIGRLIFKKTDALNSLGAAATILLFTNPFGFANISLMLSLLSTFGLLVVCPFLYDRLCALIGKFHKRGLIIKAILFPLCQTVSATIMTMPISIVVFRYLSIISPIANLLIDYPITLITVFSFLTVILLFLPLPFKVAATIPIIVLCLLVRYVVFIIRLFASFSFATIPVGPLYLIPLIIALLAIPVLLIIKRFNPDQKFKTPLKAAPIFMILCSIISFSYIYSLTPKATLTVLELGKGSSVIITEGDYTIVMGAGDGESDSTKIINKLVEKGRTKIDYLILPNANKSVAAGAPELIYDYATSTVIHPTHGDYYKKLNYISDESFTTFNEISQIKTDNFNITIIADVGCVLNAEDHSVIIYTGNNLAKSLFELATHDSPTFICIDSLPKEVLNGQASNIILSGSDENIASMETSLKTRNVDFQSCKTEHIELVLS